MSTDIKDDPPEADLSEYVSETFTKIKINILGNSCHTTILPFEYQVLHFKQAPDGKLFCHGAYDKIVTIAKEDVEFDLDTQALVVKRDHFRLVLKNDRQLRAQVMVTADTTDYSGKMPYLDIIIVDLKDIKTDGHSEQDGLKEVSRKSAQTYANIWFSLLNLELASRSSIEG